MPLAIVHMYSYMVASCIATRTSGPGLESGAAIALYLALYLSHVDLSKPLIPYMDTLGI